LCLAPPAFSQDSVVAGYYRISQADWFPPSQVRLDKLSHVIAFSWGVSPTGDFWGDPGNATLLDLRARCRQAGVKLLGCASATHDNFAPALANATYRANLVSDIATFVRAARLDGMDIDFEYPTTSAEADNLGTFMTELRSALGNRALLTAAVSSGVLSVPCVPASVVNKQLDWINIMSYAHKGEHATYASSQSDIAFFRNAGVAAGKMVLGVPFYGIHVTNRDAKMYRQLLQTYDSNPDPSVNTLGGYYFNGRDLVYSKGILGTQSVRGVFAWALDQDVADSRSLLTSLRAGVDDSFKLLDGFDYPFFGAPDRTYERSAVTLVPSERRTQGGFSARATFSFSGAAWCDGRVTSPVLPSFAFQGSANFIADVYVEEEGLGAFIIDFWDGAGRWLRGQNYSLGTAGWHRISIPRSSFVNQSTSGFGDGNIVRWRIWILGGNQGTAVAPFVKHVVFDNFGIQTPSLPSGARPQRVDLDADNTGVPDANEAVKAVIWQDRIRHPSATLPLDVYRNYGGTTFTSSWASVEGPTGTRQLDATFGFSGAKWETHWLESPRQPAVDLGANAVFHLECDVIQAMPNSYVVVDFFDDAGAYKRWENYNTFKTTGLRVFDIAPAALTGGTGGNLARFSFWRIGIQGTNTATSAFQGRVRFGPIAFGNLPVGTTLKGNFDADTDGDGLSDAAEDRNLNGVVDAGESSPVEVDTDRDGQTDVSEVIAGTDPDSGKSAFRARGATSGGYFLLSWPAAAGRQYRVSTATDPGATTWSAVSGWLTFAGAEGTFSAQRGSAARNFYRVEVKR